MILVCGNYDQTNPDYIYKGLLGVFAGDLDDAEFMTTTNGKNVIDTINNEITSAGITNNENKSIYQISESDANNFDAILLILLYNDFGKKHIYIYNEYKLSYSDTELKILQEIERLLGIRIILAKSNSITIEEKTKYAPSDVNGSHIEIYNGLWNPYGIIGKTGKNKS